MMPAATAAEAKTMEVKESSTPLLDQIAAAQAQAQARYMPVMDVKTALKRVEAIREMKELLLKPSTPGTTDGDYGIIPGTDKPSLHKAGAEKINAFFGYVPNYEPLPGTIEDWMGADHDGEPLFYYHQKCTLQKDGVPVGQGTGSCNSWESKYRFRQQNRKCPACSKETIIKGKGEYGGGWLCFARKGGCGAKFKDGDQAIEGQSTGQIVNDNIFDLVNAVQKMADKRAYVAATLSATGASQWFTQDMEDAPREKQEGKAADPQAKVTNGKPAAKPEGLFGAQASDPEALKLFMKQFTQADYKTRLAMFREGKESIVEMTQLPDAYYAVLNSFEIDGKPCQHANELKALDLQQKAVRLVWLACAKAAGGAE